MLVRADVFILSVVLLSNPFHRGDRRIVGRQPEQVRVDGHAVLRVGLVDEVLDRLIIREGTSVSSRIAFVRETSPLYSSNALLIAGSGSVWPQQAVSSINLAISRLL